MESASYIEMGPILEVINEVIRSYHAILDRQVCYLHVWVEVYLGAKIFLNSRDPLNIVGQET